MLTVVAVASAAAIEAASMPTRRLIRANTGVFMIMFLSCERSAPHSFSAGGKCCTNAAIDRPLLNNVKRNTENYTKME